MRSSSASARAIRASPSFDRAVAILEHVVRVQHLLADGKLSAARYSQPNNATTRLPAIAAFLAKARRELRWRPRHDARRCPQAMIVARRK